MLQQYVSMFKSNQKVDYLGKESRTNKNGQPYYLHKFGFKESYSTLTLISNEPFERVQPDGKPVTIEVNLNVDGYNIRPELTSLEYDDGVIK